MTTLIKKGYLLDPYQSFQRGDILIEDDLITQVAPNIDFEADTIINASDKVILPGLISAHTHISQTSMRGLTDNQPLETWLLVTHFSKSGMSPRDLYIWSAIGAVELLKTGTTSLLEHGPLVNPLNCDNQIDATTKAFSDVGIRAVVAPLYLDLSYSEFLPLHLINELRSEDIALLDIQPVPKANELIQALRSSLRRWQNSNSRISFCLGPANVIGCSRELMERTVELAAEFDLGIHTHLLETKSELLRSNKMFSQPAVDYLAAINCLGEHVSFAHGVWLDSRDIQILAETGSKLVHNPISNLKLGSGVAPVQAMKLHSLDVALGADGPGSSDSLNMFEVLKYAALIHKLYGAPSEWVNAQDAFTMCLLGGAKVLRKKVGSLQPGYLADLVILGMETLPIIPRENFVNQLVYSELGSSVETVLVGGHVVVENREVRTVDEKELYAEAREIIQKMYVDVGYKSKDFVAALNLLERITGAVSDYQLPFSRFARTE